jgi:hypothetical protein
MGTLGGNFAAVAASVSVTSLAVLAIASRRAAVFERSLAPIAGGAVAESTPGLTTRDRTALIRWSKAVIGYVAVIVVVNLSLILMPLWFAYRVLLWPNSVVSLAALVLAIRLCRRLRPPRLLARLSGNTASLVDTTSQGRVSLRLAVAGLILPVSGLLLIFVFGKIVGRESIILPRREGFGALLCFLLCFALELAAFGSGITARRTAKGKVGLVISSVVLLLISVMTVLFMLDDAPEAFIWTATDRIPKEIADDQILAKCPVIFSASSLVFLSITTRRLTRFMRPPRVIAGPVPPALADSGPTGWRGVTTARMMRVIAVIALALGLFRALFSDPDMPWWDAVGFVQVDLFVAIPTLAFAIVLCQKLQARA